MRLGLNHRLARSPQDLGQCGLWLRRPVADEPGQLSEVHLGHACRVVGKVAEPGPTPSTVAECWSE